MAEDELRKGIESKNLPHYETLIQREDGTFEIAHDLDEAIDVVDQIGRNVIESGKKDPIYGPIFDVMDEVCHRILEAEQIEDHAERDIAIAKAWGIYVDSLHEADLRLKELKEENEHSTGMPINSPWNSPKESSDK